MIPSRPADTYPGGSSGAKRHTKITPGEEARSATQPGVRDSPKNRARRAQQQVAMNSSSCSRSSTRLRLCRPTGAGSWVPPTPGSLALRARSPGVIIVQPSGLCRRKNGNFRHLKRGCMPMTWRFLFRKIFPKKRRSLAIV